MGPKGKAKKPEEMSEAQLADYFWSNRDDLYGEVVPSHTPERMEVMISARFTQSEAAQLRSAADEAKMSVSAFLRNRVMASLEGDPVDLEKARANLKDVYVKAVDALRALGYRPPAKPPAKTPRKPQGKASPRKPVRAN